MTDHYGLIGYPLTHSFSPSYFNNKFVKEGIDAYYHSIELPQITDFPHLLHTNPFLKGLNVTIPYKEAIIPYLDELDSIAAKIGAVNCIGISNGYKKGYNTDVLGFKNSLLLLLQPWHTHALILGSGGGAKSVAFVLSQLGINYKIVTSKVIDANNLACINYSQLTDAIIARHLLIINTTPLGMFPNIDTYPPIPYLAIGSRHLLYDLVYNPTQTQFLSYGKAQGATIKNGLEMLQLQAEAAWSIWHDNY